MPTPLQMRRDAVRATFIVVKNCMHIDRSSAPAHGCHHMHAAGEADADFTGFHRLERALYRDNITDAQTDLLLSNKTLAAWASELEESYVALRRRVALVRASCHLLKNSILYISVQWP